MATITLRLGDSFQMISTLENVGAVITDPPYLISFMGKFWDAEGDGGENASWHLGWLQACFAILPPGGIIKVFSATRTFHRLAAAMEEAGFILDPESSLEAWLQAQGFPKSLNVGKALDKAAGADRAVEAQIQVYLRECREALGLTKGDVDRLVFGGTTRYTWVEGRGGHRSNETYLPTPEEWVQLKEVLALDDRYDAYIEKAIPSRENRSRADGGKALQVREEPGDWGYQQGGDRWNGTRVITAPATDEAKQFDGYGTALKPGWEPFLVGRKPLGDVALATLASDTSPTV
jgi:hypothetical protein